jgi:hypothetical protein
MQCRLDHTPFGHLYAYQIPEDPHTSIVTGLNSSATAMVSMVFPRLSLVTVLHQGIDALDAHARCFQKEPHFATTLRQQRDTLRRMYERLNESIPVTTQYRLLYPSMAWFNRNTESSYIALSQREPLSLLFLMYFYSVFVILVVAMPATDTPFFVSFRVRAVLNLVLALKEGRGEICQGCSRVHDYIQLTNFPLNVIQLYQQHRKSNGD